MDQEVARTLGELERKLRELERTLHAMSAAEPPEGAVEPPGPSGEPLGAGERPRSEPFGGEPAIEAPPESQPSGRWSRIVDETIERSDAPAPAQPPAPAPPPTPAQAKGIGIINGSPFGSALLTDRGPADWHPASAQDRATFKTAADFCRKRGTSIAKLALQFASQNPSIPTTLFSSANPESVRRNVEWHQEPVDLLLVAEVQKLLEPVRNKQWDY